MEKNTEEAADQQPKLKLFNLEIIMPGIFYALGGLSILLVFSNLAPDGGSAARNLYYVWVALMLVGAWFLMRYLRKNIGGSFIWPVLISLVFVFVIPNYGMLIFPLALSASYYFLSKRQSKRS